MKFNDNHFLPPRSTSSSGVTSHGHNTLWTIHHPTYPQRSTFKQQCDPCHAPNLPAKTSYSQNSPNDLGRSKDICDGADNIRVYEPSFGSDIVRNQMALFHVGTDGKVCEITLTVMSEDQQDILRYLRDVFHEIWLRYRDRLNPDWPGDARLRQLLISSFGLFVFAAIAGRFIGDTGADDPNSQLLKILDAVTLEKDSLNPPHGLDLLYRQILSSVPAEILPTAMRILGMLVRYRSLSLSIQEQANFLRIDRSTFYHSVERLHSVLDIPTTPKAPIRFYHASFPDYLLSPERSGNFSIDETAVHFDVAIHSLRWMNLPRQALYRGMCPWTCVLNYPKLTPHLHVI